MNRAEVKLVKEMGYERIDCVCGRAVLPVDPSPDLTLMVRRIAIEEGAKFSIIDTTYYPSVLHEDECPEIPFVVIGKNIYTADGSIIRSALRKEKK